MSSTTPKKLPKGVKTTRRNYYKKDKVQYRVDYDIVSSDSGNKYYKTAEILPVSPPDKSLIDEIKDFNLENAVDAINAKMDSNAKEQPVESVFEMDVTDQDVVDFNSVFMKFRKMLIDKKEVVTNFVNDKDSTKPDNQIKQYAKGDTYNISANNVDETYVKKLELWCDIIIAGIINGINQIPDINYVENSETINPNDPFKWTKKEKDILEKQENRENALYVVGQVFDVIDPDFNDSFVQKKVIPSGSSESTNFFNMIQTPLQSSVVKTDNYKFIKLSNDSGVIIWKNGNVFEGEVTVNPADNTLTITSGTLKVKKNTGITGMLKPNEYDNFDIDTTPNTYHPNMIEQDTGAIQTSGAASSIPSTPPSTPRSATTP